MSTHFGVSLLAQHDTAALHVPSIELAGARISRLASDCLHPPACPDRQRRARGDAAAKALRRRFSVIDPRDVDVEMPQARSLTPLIVAALQHLGGQVERQANIETRIELGPFTDTQRAEPSHATAGKSRPRVGAASPTLVGDESRSHCRPDRVGPAGCMATRRPVDLTAKVAGSRALR
jgi:hypothetical protein